MSFWYIATPYTKYPAGIAEAYREACRQTAILMKAGVPAFSPIAHTDPIARYGEIDPLDVDLWLGVDEPLMRAARGIIVVMMDGWDKSKGVNHEINAFRDAGKPIVYMMPGLIPREVLSEQRRRIIGLCGYARSGKDEAAHSLTAIGFTRIAFADAVRESLMALDPAVSFHSDGHYRRLSFIISMLGWDEAKTSPEIRAALQRMGTEVGRNIIGENCWIDVACRKISDSRSPVVVTDIRFPNEAAAVRSLGGKVIRVDRPGVGPVNDHASEKIDVEPDATIVNDGSIDELHKKAVQLADSLFSSRPMAQAA